ncbi:hypothetical protein C4D60_Mb05t25270 [Musa balbisiana]|uniref:Uncharacterized protein n=1 Tax=Musa balbisiana TaxID=52838 RepID=A0A4S8JYS4_MUSBA|nr:hypothetical protein C4D60_Mb05t25270 [Musa balbisiana]
MGRYIRVDFLRWSGTEERTNRAHDRRRLLMMSASALSLSMVAMRAERRLLRSSTSRLSFLM